MEQALLSRHIIVSAKFCNVTFLSNFYFVSFFYRLFICRPPRKIRLVTLSQRYLYKFFFWAFFISIEHLSFVFVLWTQIKHSKLFLKHNFWRQKRTHCIAYNKIYSTIIVHIIVLILGEISSKGSSFTSLLFASFCRGCRDKSWGSYYKIQPWQKHCREKAEAKCIFI